MIFERDKTYGFTLVELLVVIAIISILAAVVILVINPLELLRRSRDAQRIKDLDNIAQVINVSLQEASLASNSIVSILCKESGSYPCAGSSHLNSRLTDGTGWVKANLTLQKSVSLPTLPIDPLNNAEYHYTYCADSDTWEINTVLESDQQGYRMTADGGNEADRYEIGSNYLLLASGYGVCEF